MDIGAVGIKFLRLENGVEYPEIGGGTGAGDPLPLRRVGGGIAIDKCILEPALPLAPVDLQMFDQERADNHAYPVMHSAGLPKSYRMPASTIG